MFRPLIFSLLGASVLLTACGGGGGSSTTPPNRTANNAVRLSNANPDQEGMVDVAFEYDATQTKRTFTDADGDFLTYTVTFSPDNGDFTATAGVIKGTPSVRGDVSVTIKASDGLTSASDTFIIAVAPQPTPVVLASPNPDQTARVGTAFTYDATRGGTVFTDDDGDVITYTTTVAPANLGLTANAAGVVSGTPTAAGTATVTIVATDGKNEATDTFTVTIAPDISAVERTFGNKIDLDNLANYANQTVPYYIPANIIPAPEALRTPVTDAGATLGRVLFYDRNLSVDNTVACASCHQQANAFSDRRVVSNGVLGGRTGRHSMRLINTAYQMDQNSFWDERADDVQDQVTMPIADHNEHGFSGQNGRPDFNDLITKLEAIDYYQELFTFVYGDPRITRERMAQALSQFVNSITSFDSKFDTGYAATIGNLQGDALVAALFQDFPNFTRAENDGKWLYMTGFADGGAGCRQCHEEPAFNIFPDSRHIGVIGVAGDPNATDLTNTKSPSLRDLTGPNGENGPFMHDGSITTLRGVIDHYNAIPVPTTEPLRTEFFRTIDPQLIDPATGTTRQLGLTAAQRDEIVAFLRTLQGTAVFTDPRWSDPFN